MISRVGVAAALALTLTLICGEAASAAVYVVDPAASKTYSPGRFVTDVTNTAGILSRRDSLRFDDVVLPAEFEYQTFEFSLTYTGIASESAEQWSVSVQNGTGINGTGQTLLGRLAANSTSATFSITAAQAAAFDYLKTSKIFTFVFSEPSGGNDTFTLSGASLKISGTMPDPVPSPIPLPGAGILLLGALGGLGAAARRRKAA